jgi:hypothetical protein
MIWEPESFPLLPRTVQPAIPSLRFRSGGSRFGPRAVGLVSTKGVTGRKVEKAGISRIQWRALSRRAVIVRSLACAAGAAASLAPVEEASAKTAQKIAEYQETPKGDQQYSNCNLFQEPNACTLVDGEISPAGWCKFGVKKTG